jgi:hypothetical protein
MVDYNKYKSLIDILNKQNITPKEAIEIFERAAKLNPTNPRTQWKMFRLSMFLWARIEEDKAGFLGKKSDTIRRLIANPKYKRLYQTFPGHGEFNPEKEFKNLSYLINDPRQAPFLKSKYHVFENTQKPIPQDLIDKLK